MINLFSSLKIGGMRKTAGAVFVLFAAAAAGIGSACARGPSDSGTPMFSLEPIPGRIVASGSRVAIESPSVLRDPEHFVWGGSAVRGDDGRYHLFYSRFDCGSDRPPFEDAWLLSSEIAYAVSDRPDSGFIFQKTVLQGALHDGRPDAWDAQGVHNPHVKKFGGSYYLYYIGSRDPGPQPEGSPGAELSKRDRIQQTQKIGVIAVRNLDDLIEGRFARPDSPILSPRTRVKADRVIDPSPPGTKAKPDNLVVVNPSVVFRPADGKYLLYFKGNLWDPRWRGVHGVAVGDSPVGPFRALDDYVFDVRMPDGRLVSAEDPFVWYHAPSRLFFAVMKDFTGRITRAEPGLGLMVSEDGIAWSAAENPLFSPIQLTFEDGTVLQVSNLERPQMLLDGEGTPLAFYAACSVEPVGGKTDGTTFNVQFGVKTIVRNKNR